MKNDGEYPLPSKSTGEGSHAAANVDAPLRGSNGQGAPGAGEIKAPLEPGATSGHGSKEHNSVAVNQSSSM